MLHPTHPLPVVQLLCALAEALHGLLGLLDGVLEPGDLRRLRVDGALELGRLLLELFITEFLHDGLELGVIEDVRAYSYPK